MAASWSSRDKSFKGLGCKEGGACEASGGMETLDASGAEVCGTSDAVGLHGNRECFEAEETVAPPLVLLAASLFGLGG